MFYDNFYECIFRIWPKLRYEANKFLRKANREKILMDEQLDLIKKRVDNENIANEKLI